ncbi:hypothetical protein V6N12_001574 [Hibiscus sabdariffa]|uniref:Uncharacterized protein n=1 Tax=Hibiscus sabdariffa TaxID=183260 RepID=A0ABR2A3A0_9ROSI
MGCKSSENKPKAKHRRGLWSPEEDLKLRNYVLHHGHGCWSSVPINAGGPKLHKVCLEEQIMRSRNYWHSYLKKRIAKAEEIESHSSSSENKESTSSPQNLSDQTPSYEPFGHIEQSLVNTHQAIPQRFDFSKESQGNPIPPKLLFAEWLSLDQDSHNFTNSGKPVATSDGFNHGPSSNFQDPFMNAYLLNEGAFSNGLHYGLSNESSVNEMFSSQIKFETQILGNEFVSSLSGDDTCSDFNMSNDLMYI